MVLSVFLFLLFLCSHSLTVPCSGPVTYNTTEFTIRGPCPNDVLIAPVGDTVQYRCDYEEKATGFYIPYWHITGLLGSPFSPDEQNDHQIIVDFSSVEEYTTLSITVLEQYLNKSLSIQCGLCSITKCGSEPLSENISSKPVKLAAFSTPSSLSHFFVRDFVSLSWSPPSVSADYTDQVYFNYEISLTNTINSSEVLQYTTNVTNFTISQLQVQHDCCTCTVYWWNVSATVDERNSDSFMNNESFSVPSVPFIQNGSIHANITECIGTIIISVDYRVVSCLHADVFQNIVYFENAIQTVSSNNISSKLLSNHAYAVNSMIILSGLDVLNGAIIVNVSNRLGSQTISFKITEDTIDVHHTCDEDVTTVIKTLIRSITMSSLVINTSGGHHLTSTAFIDSVSSVLPPKPNTSTPAYIIYIVVVLILFVACFLAAMFVISIIIIRFKLQKRKPVLNVVPPSECKNKSKVNDRDHSLNTSESNEKAPTDPFPEVQK